MNNIISDLWNGNIAPCEHCGAHDPVANKLISLMERNREMLCSEMTEVQKESFQKYMDCSEEYLLRMLELAFFDGFVLASKLAAEALQ